MKFLCISSQQKVCVWRWNYLSQDTEQCHVSLECFYLNFNSIFVCLKFGPLTYHNCQYIVTKASHYFSPYIWRHKMYIIILRVNWHLFEKNGFSILCRVIWGHRERGWLWGLLWVLNPPKTWDKRLLMVYDKLVNTCQWWRTSGSYLWSVQYRVSHKSTLTEHN